MSFRELVRPRLGFSLSRPRSCPEEVGAGQECSVGAAVAVRLDAKELVL